MGIEIARLMARVRVKKYHREQYPRVAHECDIEIGKAGTMDTEQDHEMLRTMYLKSDGRWCWYVIRKWMQQ